jgi:hypothetical protein
MSVIALIVGGCENHTSVHQQWAEIFIKDLDGDGKMDTVFLAHSYLECKLSVLGYNPIKTRNEYDYLMKLKSTDFGFSFSISWDAETIGEYEFRYNQKKKNMQLISVKIFVGVGGNVLESKCYFIDEKWDCSDYSFTNTLGLTDKSKAVFLDSDENGFF